MSLTGYGDPPALRFGVFWCARSRCSPRAPCVCRAAHSHPEALSAPGLIRLGSRTPPGQLPPGAWGPQGHEGSRDCSTPGGVPAAGCLWGMHTHPGGGHTRTRVSPGAPEGPPFPTGARQGRFSAPLGTAVPAHNDMVIASRARPHARCSSPAPSFTGTPPCPPRGLISALPQHPAAMPGAPPHTPRGGCRHLLAPQLGNPSFPSMFTRVTGVLRRCTSHFLLGHFHLCPRIMIFSATLI